MRFARAGAGQIAAVEQDEVQFFGQVAEARDTVLREAGGGEAAVFEQDLLAQHGAGPQEDAAFHLRARVPGVENGAALEGFDDLDKADGAGARTGLDFDASGDDGVFLCAAGEARGAAGGPAGVKRIWVELFLPPRRAGARENGRS
jgi:hypothetical protein